MLWSSGSRQQMYWLQDAKCWLGVMIARLLCLTRVLVSGAGGSFVRQTRASSGVRRRGVLPGLPHTLDTWFSKPQVFSYKTGMVLSTSSIGRRLESIWEKCWQAEPTQYTNSSAFSGPEPSGCPRGRVRE